MCVYSICMYVCKEYISSTCIGMQLYRVCVCVYIINVLYTYLPYIYIYISYICIYTYRYTASKATMELKPKSEGLELDDSII